MADFSEHIKAWVDIDNQLRIVNDKAKELRKARSQEEERILEYVETNSLNNATVKISDGKLRFTESKQTSALTFKHVEECLMDCIQNEASVKKIMKYIRDKRETKVVTDIKRSYASSKK